MKCSNCGKTVKQTKGKRAKIYCNPDCRQKHWVKNHKKKATRGPGRPKKEPKPIPAIKIDEEYKNNTVTEIQNITATKDPIQEVAEYPEDFRVLLKMAKESDCLDISSFKNHVSISKALSPNQKSMVLSKLK